MHVGADSSLVRLLLDWGFAEAPAPGPEWAPRLAGWLDAFGAIELDAAQKSMPQADSASGAARKLRTPAPEAVLRRVREELEAAIAAPDPTEGPQGWAAPSPPPVGVKQAWDGPAPASEPDAGPLPGDAKRALASPPDEQDFRPHRSRYLALQRRMDTKVGAAREKVRDALGRAGPELARLAMLDAALERTLGVQMQARFAVLPRLLELRFARSREAGPSDFARDVAALLRAELDVRLAPVEGMVEAFGRKAGEWR
ncbi:MAG: hypothetical protein RIS35_3520 [Pseudomonadota bacterium]